MRTKLRLDIAVKGFLPSINIIEIVIQKQYSMNLKLDPIFSQEETRFSRSTLDHLKEHDLRTLFETLITQPSYRTIADVNTLIKIITNVPSLPLSSSPSRNYAVPQWSTTSVRACS